MKVKFLLLFFGLVSSFNYSYSASFIGISADSSNDVFQIGEVRSIKFDQQPNADKGYRTIVFNSEYSNERTNSSVSSIVVYPNPVAEYIVVFGVEEMDEVVIMTIDGVVVSRSQGSRIDVSKLQQGSYILTVNGKLVKFIKK